MTVTRAAQLALFAVGGFAIWVAMFGLMPAAGTMFLLVCGTLAWAGVIWLDK